MAIGSREIKSISGGSQAGRKALDEFNPTKFGMGSKAPQSTGTAATAKNTDTANCGDATTDGIINNSRTRIEELELILIANGIIAAP